jgi:cell division septation protein DedD
MDTAMRDMEHLRERGDDGLARKIGVIGLAVAAGLGLIFAIGVLIGNAADADDTVPEEDPLARLDRAAGLEAGSTEDESVPTVERESLTFPEALEDSRPEVESAVAAAAAEEAHPDPIDGRPVTVPAAVAGGDDDGDAPASAPLAHPSLPAAISATPARDILARALPRDALVAAALPEPPAHAAAPSGRDGEYTLQVSSLPGPAQANAFSDQLRARGHRAFVVVADVPNRGRHWRVRIGPFETMGEAESYRREFENTERMNTYVVRRPREEQEGPIGD